MIRTAQTNPGIFKFLRSKHVDAVDIVDLETPGIIDWVRASGADELRLERLLTDVKLGRTYAWVVPVSAEFGVKLMLLIMPSLPEDMKGEELTPNLMHQFGAKILYANMLWTVDV